MSILPHMFSWFIFSIQYYCHCHQNLINFAMIILLSHYTQPDKHMYKNGSLKEVEVLKISACWWNKKRKGNKKWNGHRCYVRVKVEVEINVEVSRWQNMPLTSCCTDKSRFLGLHTYFSWLWLIYCFQWWHDSTMALLLYLIKCSK